MKTLPRTVWEVLKFEAVCKLLAVCLVYPLLSGVFRIYATSEGLHFNGGLIPAFLSPAGIVVVVFVALGATAFVYWEISTVIRIAALTRQAVPFTWREVWWGSLWGFGALRGVSLPVSGVFCLGVWPLCAIGYVNSLLPTLALPEFIYGELRRYGELGMAVMILIPALYYLAGMLCLFAPLYMALRRQRFFAAAGESLRAWKRSFWQNGRPAWQGPAVVAACLVWMNVATHIAQFWRRNRLDLVDFDAAFSTTCCIPRPSALILPTGLCGPRSTPPRWRSSCGCCWRQPTPGKCSVPKPTLPGRGMPASSPGCCAGGLAGCGRGGWNAGAVAPPGWRPAFSVLRCWPGPAWATRRRRLSMRRS